MLLSSGRYKEFNRTAPNWNFKEITMTKTPFPAKDVLYYANLKTLTIAIIVPTGSE
jgi:hypothetical protein